MLTIDDCIHNIRTKGVDQSLYAKDLEHLYRRCDFVKMLQKAEQSLRCISTIYLYNRMLLVSLYGLIPSLPRTVDIHKAECEALNISVEKVDAFLYPVYKISLPILLPNKRRKKADRNDAITSTVYAAVRRYCNENNIEPFEHATVIIATYYENSSFSIDNDNIDSAIIMNGLSGCFIRDDSCTCVGSTIYYSEQVIEGALTEIYIVDSKHDCEVYSKIKAE